MARTRSSHSSIGLWPTRTLVALYLAIVVGLPLIAAIAQLWGQPIALIREKITAPVAVASVKLSIESAVIAAVLNAVMGLWVAWILTRYRFPFRRVVDALIDLPFAMPAVVAGIAFMALYGPSSTVGGWLNDSGAIGHRLLAIGLPSIQLTGGLAGLVLANLFVTLPFVVRTVQPVIGELESDVEEAAAGLGASPIQVFFRIIFPQLFPAVLAGFGLAFARGINEFGVAVLVSGNVPFSSLIGPVYVYQQLDAMDYVGATAVSGVLLGISMSVLLLTYLWTRWAYRHG